MSKSRQKFNMSVNDNSNQQRRGYFPPAQFFDFEESNVRLEKNAGRRSRKGDPRGKNRKEYYESY